MDKQPNRETHPAYGMIAINRIHGGNDRRFYGSPLQTHGHFIEITIRRSYRYHELSEDRYMADKEIASIRLTASQFTSLITGMNIGDGVPCTLNRIKGEYQGEVPETELLEVERIQDGYAGKVAALLDKLPDIETEVNTILARPNLRKADKARLRTIFGVYRRHITDTAPFALKQFREATGRVADVAKREVVEFVSAMIQRTGIEALRGQDNAIKSITNGENERG